MTLKRLSLHGFRNLKPLSLDVDNGFNFFFGKNAQGKTNVIEAIHYLSELKSFRASDKIELIQHGADCAKLLATTDNNSLLSDIQITLTKDAKHVLVNGKKPKSQKDYASLLPVLLFEPRHIYLFRDSPSERRRYLNRALYLQDAGTLPLMRDYDKIIAQKNKILKDPLLQNGRSHAHLDAWNDRLVGLGAQIMCKRLAWFAALQNDLACEYTALSHTGETLQFQYLPSIALQHNSDAPLTEDALQKQFFSVLNEKQNEEMQRREAFVGPHRDDFRAFIDTRNLALYGSQGENRSVVIALKLAQLKLYHKKFGKMPLFLLDDVASELDSTRCAHLFSYLRDESVQAFLTTTENDRITPDFLGKSACFEIRDGVCEKFSGGIF